MNTSLPNVAIGNSVVIGVNSAITKDVPAYSAVAGNSAKVIKDANQNG